MPITTKVLLTTASLLVLFTIIQLVRKKRLDEKYAMLWILVGAVLLLAPIEISFIDKISNFLGFHYPPSFVLLLGFLGLCLINLQFSVAISRLSKQNKILAQRFAILEHKTATDIPATP